MNVLLPSTATLGQLTDVMMIDVVDGSGLLTGNIDAYGGGGFNTRQTEMLAVISPDITFTATGQTYTYILSYKWNPTMTNYVNFNPNGTQFTINLLSYRNNASAWVFSDALYNIQVSVRDIV